MLQLVHGNAPTPLPQRRRRVIAPAAEHPAINALRQLIAEKRIYAVGVVAQTIERLLRSGESLNEPAADRLRKATETAIANDHALTLVAMSWDRLPHDLRWSVAKVVTGITCINHGAAIDSATVDALQRIVTFVQGGGR